MGQFVIYDGPQGTCCKQKTIAANKKKDALQTKNAVAIWSVTGQGFQNTKWPAVRYFQ